MDTTRLLFSEIQLWWSQKDSYDAQNLRAKQPAPLTVEFINPIKVYGIGYGAGLLTTLAEVRNPYYWVFQYNLIESISGGLIKHYPFSSVGTPTVQYVNSNSPEVFFASPVVCEGLTPLYLNMNVTDHTVVSTMVDLVGSLKIWYTLY